MTEAATINPFEAPGSETGVAEAGATVEGMFKTTLVHLDGPEGYDDIGDKLDAVLVNLKKAGLAQYWPLMAHMCCTVFVTPDYLLEVLKRDKPEAEMHKLEELLLDMAGDDLIQRRNERLVPSAIGSKDIWKPEGIRLTRKGHKIAYGSLPERMPKPY